MNSTGVTFTKILGGAYKTLSIANQVIPLYKQVSPMIKNARSAFSIISELNKSNKQIQNYKTKEIVSNIKLQKKESSLNNPVFFV